MNRFETLIEDLDKANLEFIEAEFEPVLKIVEDFRNYVKTLQNVGKQYKETKTLPDLDYKDWEALAKNGAKRATNSQKGKSKDASKSASKENVEPTTSPPSTRPRRNAFKEATENINHQSSMSLVKKLRRPDTSAHYQNVYVKAEKLSIGETDISDNVTIKTEAEEMPAPKKPAPKKKQKIKVEVKLEKLDEEMAPEKPKKAPSRKDSDVIVQDVPIPTIELTDSDDDTQKKQKPVRQTRTKTKAKTEPERKRTRAMESSDTDSKEDSAPKRSKSEITPDSDPSNQSKYDDAVSTIITENGAQNATSVSASLNTTVVIEKPKIANIPKLEDFMTDDDSETDNPPPKPSKKGIPKPVTKQVFSPYENSPVKKKVEAFERLHEATAPTRVTRTKTRAQAKDQSEDEAPTQPPPPTEPKSVAKEKSKLCTPLQSKFLPKACSTNRTTKAMPQSASDSLISTKAQSALKASQAEYRERERKRKEKEEEALKKREALIHSQMEEKKRKREEKQLKAQQLREEVLEKEKLKTLEVQRLKDERHKKLIAEQEERKLKQKEEIERKRKLIKVKAAQEKKREEEKRLEEQRQMDRITADLDKQDAMAKVMEKKNSQKERKVPIYMRTRAPILPTDDCYDSDDENYREGQVAVASWAKGAAIKNAQLSMLAAGESIKNTFFSRLAVTPDLTDIFEVIDQSKLKRSSSAIWRRPPRFTMMPDVHLESFVEDDE